MRKFALFTVALMCLNFISYAQIIKGSTFLGGSAYIGSSSYKDDFQPANDGKTTNWGITPQFGKAIATNKIFGAFFNYNNRKNEMTSTTNNLIDAESFYGGGVFYRSYFPLSSRFYLFGEGTIGGGAGKNERKVNKTFVSNSNQTNVALAISPGISFAASKKLHLETSLNNLFSVAYQSIKTKEYDANGSVIRNSSSKQFNAVANANGFSGLSIGLRWILPSTK